MTTTILMGILAIIAGIIVLAFPLLLNYVVGIVLIIFGIWALYLALTGRRALV